MGKILYDELGPDHELVEKADFWSKELGSDRKLVERDDFWGKEGEERRLNYKCIDDCIKYSLWDTTIDVSRGVIRVTAFVDLWDFGKIGTCMEIGTVEVDVRAWVEEHQPERLEHLKRAKE
jgi:hypothetical protein